MAITKNKAVVKLGVTDCKSTKAVKKALADVDLKGFSSYTLDLEKSTLVVIGEFDPTVLVHRLRKLVSADLMTFGPVKDEGKPSKNDGGGGGGGGGKVDQKPQQQQQLVYRPFDYVTGPYGYSHGYPCC